MSRHQSTTHIKYFAIFILICITICWNYCTINIKVLLKVGSMDCIRSEKSLNISFGEAQWLIKSGIEVYFSCVDDPNCFPFIYKTMYLSFMIIKNWFFLLSRWGPNFWPKPILFQLRFYLSNSALKLYLIMITSEGDN